MTEAARYTSGLHPSRAADKSRRRVLSARTASLDLQIVTQPLTFLKLLEPNDFYNLQRRLVPKRCGSTNRNERLERAELLNGVPP